MTSHELRRDVINTCIRGIYIQQLLAALENTLRCVKMFNFVVFRPYLASSVDAACLNELPKKVRKVFKNHPIMPIQTIKPSEQC
ncbi:MAG: hypothetical protein EZS28_011011 [Streblomastix strix]|uniref:Uncharacterized protein n=1 Tax=Streblomastix strix TaxID=222440 RepID=A0A5J4WGJ0_9EUKA|nr:MAG: hypothetical protein EZS28_011011 [Streblomastix strix]